jgi:hypothetical protein
LEDIKANIQAELWNRDTMFLLANDSKIMEQLDKRTGNYDIEVLDSISKRLKSILEISLPGIEPGLINHSEPESHPLKTKNYDVFNGTRYLATFHRDAIDEHYVMLNVWIALEDVTARPLAFIKTSEMLSSTPNGGVPDFHPDGPDGKYIIVPNMKKGQMLIFLASQRAHGSPIIEGNNDPRFSAVFGYMIQVRLFRP